MAAPKYPERAAVQLCAAVRCCALLCAASARDSTPRTPTSRLHPRRGLPPKSAPCKISSKHKQQSRFRAATARAGHGRPRRRVASSAAGELDLSAEGFCFRSSTSSATGLNPSSFCRAFRMRRVGSHTGRSGKFCERTSVCDACMEWRGVAFTQQPRLKDCRRSFHVACAAAKTAPGRHITCDNGSRLRDFATNMAKAVSAYYLTYPLSIMSYNVHTHTNKTVTAV